MCGIAFDKFDNIKNILKLQKDRGLDWMWIITKQLWTIKWWPKEDSIEAWISVEAYIDTLEKYYEEQNITSGNVIMHHRKASIGSKGATNAHPYYWSKFSLIQNGTSKDMRTWWDIELICRTKSDTYCFLQYIERHCNTLEEIAVLLDKAIWTIWVIMVSDWERILFYSDKLRESYIVIEDNKVVRISSKNIDETVWEYYNKWYILFNFEWDIIEKNLTSFNEKKIITPSTYYWHYNVWWTYNNTSTNEEANRWTDMDDFYYFLLISEDVLNKKEQRIFLTGFDEILKVNKESKYISKTRPNFWDKLMSNYDYEYKLWERRNKKMIKLLKKFNMYPKINIAESRLWWWYSAIRSDGVKILNTLREQLSNNNYNSNRKHKQLQTDNYYDTLNINNTDTDTNTGDNINIKNNVNTGTEKISDLSLNKWDVVLLDNNRVATVKSDNVVTIDWKEYIVFDNKKSKYILFEQKDFDLPEWLSWSNLLAKTKVFILNKIYKWT